METTTIHPAEAYLRNEQNPPSLYVSIAGKRRRLFINRGRENVIGIIALGKRKSGYVFTDWASIEKIYYPSSSPKDAADTEKKLLLKYQKLARLATHTNGWLREIAMADPEKSLYENHITTGTAIDGKRIRLSTIEKYFGATEMRLFREAMKIKRNSPPAVSISADMTVRYGASHAKMEICRQASARNIGIVEMATTTCLSTMSM